MAKNEGQLLDSELARQAGRMGCNGISVILPRFFQSIARTARKRKKFGAEAFGSVVTDHAFSARFTAAPRSTRMRPETWSSDVGDGDGSDGSGGGGDGGR